METKPAIWNQVSRHTLSMRHHERCIECNVTFSPTEDRFLINDRHWCATCAAPYQSSALGGFVKDSGIFVVAALAAAATILVLYVTPLSRLSLFGAALAFAGVLASWFTRRRVRVDRIPGAAAPTSTPTSAPDSRRFPAPQRRSARAL